MEHTLDLKKPESGKQNHQYDSLLDLIIQFNRDFSLNLPLYDLLKKSFRDDCESDDDDD